MRIGILVERVDGQNGGGHTFQDAILQEIQSRKLLGDHQIVYVSRRPETSGMAGCLRLSDEDGWQSRLWRLFLKLVPQGIGAGTEGLKARIEGAAASSHIDVLFLPSPGYIESLGVPQIGIVWDLAHRYVPIFPELTHGGEIDRRERFWQRFFVNVDQVIVGTQRGEKELEMYYGVDPARVWRIPHPTPHDAVELGFGVSVLPRKKREAIAIYPAQFWAHKNHVILLDAWETLVASGRTERLVFTGGDRGNMEYLRKIAEEKGIQDFVEFRGFVDRSEVIDLYRRASLLLFPCVFGPENLPPLEAGSFGCPAVVASVPGIDEQLGEAVVYADPYDKSEWVNGVKAMLDDVDLWNEKSKALRDLALNRTVAGFVDSLTLKLDGFEKRRRLWSQVDH